MEQKGNSQTHFRNNTDKAVYSKELKVSWMQCDEVAGSCSLLLVVFLYPVRGFIRKLAHTHSATDHDHSL